MMRYSTGGSFSPRLMRQHELDEESRGMLGGDNRGGPAGMGRNAKPSGYNIHIPKEQKMQ